MIGTAALTLPAQARPLAAPIDIVMQGDATGSDVTAPREDPETVPPVPVARRRVSEAV